MNKYGKLFILINYVFIVLVLFLPSKTLVWGQIMLLSMFFFTYFAGDNKSIEFLSKFKYNLLLNFVLYFIFRENSDAYKIGVEQSLMFSKIVVNFSIVMFGYILLREDRLVRLCRKEEGCEK